MTRDFRDSLDDMLEYAKQAQAFVDTMWWKEFEADAKTFFAAARAIEIVGEAARHIPEDVQRRFPAIPWRQIIGMRNVLAHNYDGADPRIVYDTVTLFLPGLIDALPAVIADVDATR